MSPAVSAHELESIAAPIIIYVAGIVLADIAVKAIRVWRKRRDGGK